MQDKWDNVTYRINSIGLKGLPWGAPCSSLRISLSFTVNHLSCKKLLIHLIRFICNPKPYNLESSPLCHTCWNTFSTSKNITVEIIHLLKFRLIDCISLNKLSFVHLFFLKPFCCKLMLWFLIFDFWFCLSVTFQKFFLSMK